MLKLALLEMAKASKLLFVICLGLRATYPSLLNNDNLLEPWTLIPKDSVGRELIDPGS